MAFLDELEQTTNVTLTENGATTNRSTLNPVLDFFSRAGAMRKDPDGALTLFKAAYAYNKILAIKALFYLRDVRGGQGERAIFWHILDWFASINDNVTLHKLLPLIPEYGRWDEAIFWDIVTNGSQLIEAQLKADEIAMKDGKPVSLLAKWMPSENSSSGDSQNLARNIMAALELKPRQYRKRVSALRAYIKLLEHKMSANQWSEIEYDKLPGQAFRKHTKAFTRHDAARFTEFITKAEKGEAKINAGTLYTYEIYEHALAGEAAADAMWANLPDYTQGKPALVMADVSGSMEGRPMAVSVSLALYFAQRNQGAFNGYYMTFTNRPSLVHIPEGVNLTTLLQFIEYHDVGYNTNLEAAFDAILAAAIKSNTLQSELPQTLYIISDMEFDSQMDGCDETNFETAKRKFTDAGYMLPHVVFWNVDARNSQSPATIRDGDVTLISGLSPSVFKLALEGKTPLESMLEVLNAPRYDPVEAALKMAI